MAHGATWPAESTTEPETGTAGICAIEAGGRIVFADGGFAELLGACQADLAGALLLAFVPEPDREAASAALTRCCSGETSVKIPFRCAGGSVLVLAGRVAPMRDAAGNVAGLVISFTGVPAGAGRASEALLRSEQRYRSLVAATTCIVWTTDARGDFAEPQLSWEAYTGQPWEEHRGGGWMNAVHPDDRENVVRAWYAAAAGRKTYEHESRHYHASSGEYRHVLVRAAPVLNPDGSVREWIGTCTDVHDRREAERRLAEASAHLKLHIDTSPLAAIELDGALRVTTWSRRAEEIFGWTAASAVGMDVGELAPAAARGDFTRALASGGGPAVSFSTRNRRGDGTSVWCDWYCSAVRDARGMLTSVLALVLDATARHEAEERIAQLNRDLQRRITELETLFDVIPIGIGIADGPECRRIAMNPASARALGIPQGVNPGKTAPEAGSLPFRFFRNGAEVRGEDLPMEVAARDGIAVHGVELDVVHDDGRTVRLWASSAPLFDEAGRPRGSVGAFADITERRRAEEERERLLAEHAWHRGLFEALMENVPAGIAIADAATGAIRMVSRHGLEIGGASLPGGEAAREISETLLSRAMRNGETVRDEELMLLRPGGANVTVLCNAGPMRDREGRVIGGVAVWTDISARKRAEAELRASEVRFRKLVEASPIGINIGDITGRMTYANRAFLEMVGLDEQAVEDGNVRWDAITPPEWAAADREAVREAFERGYSAPYEKEYIRADGARVPACTAVALLHEPGPAAEGMAFVVDMSRLKEAERALAISQQRLELATAATGIGIFDYDLDTGEIVWTAQEEALYGLAPGTFGGSVEHWKPLAHPEDLPRILAVLDAAKAERRPACALEFRIVLPDGSVRWLASSVRILYSEDGTACRLIGTDVDITERRKAEEALRERQKLESVGLLAGGIAHDFNNLLVGIMGGTSLACESLPPGDPALGLLQAVETAAERAAHLTRQLLAYAGKGKFFIEPVDLLDAVHTARELLKPSTPDGVRVNIDCAAPGLRVEADKGQVQQLIVNLMANAVESIPEGAPGTVEVAIGLERIDDAFLASELPDRDIAPGNYAVIEVRDTGCGMDEATLARIFDPFFTTKFTGRGLGLAAVQGIVRGYGGAMRVSSEPGRGSIFTVYLPGALAVSAASEAAVVESERTVLIIGEDANLRGMAEAALGAPGRPVRVAAGIPDALDYLERHAPDVELVLMDAVPPLSGAVQAVRALRERYPDIPLVLASAMTDAVAAREFGGDISAFVRKPFTAGRLLRAVEKFLRPPLR